MYIHNYSVSLGLGYYLGWSEERIKERWTGEKGRAHGEIIVIVFVGSEVVMFFLSHDRVELGLGNGGLDGHSHHHFHDIKSSSHITHI